MAHAQEGQPQDRLRPPPAERFAGGSNVVDLHAELANLRAEPHPARDGHRQVTIFHRSPFTQVLFAFEAGGVLPDHSAPGVVTIHVLDGRLTVRAEGTDHVLPGGSILILKPGLPHDVRAVEPSTMLLTVHLEDK